VQVEKGYIRSLTKDAKTHFLQTIIRFPNRRFQLELLFTKDPDLIKSMFNIALKGLLWAKKTIAGDLTLRQNPNKFVKAYKDDELMTRLNLNTLSKDAPKIVFLHHAVKKTKSRKEKNTRSFRRIAHNKDKTSFNQIAVVGPVVQRSLIQVVRSFKRHTYILIVDIKRLYPKLLVGKTAKN
jgi:hypothetical protein